MEFFEGDIHDPAPGGPFDAVVERAVLMYVPDPAEVLRRQATVLRAGGLVVPIEIDFTTARALPASPLANQAELADRDVCERRHSLDRPASRAIVQEAGLRPLEVIGIQPYFGPEDPAAVSLLAGVTAPPRP